MARIFGSILIAVLAALSASFASAEQSAGGSSDPGVALSKLSTLFSESHASGAQGEAARRALCDSSVSSFFDWWLPEVMVREAEPVRRELSGLSFGDSTESARRQRARAYNTLEPSMSIVTSKFMIAQTYRFNVERRCENSSQREGVIDALGKVMSQPPSGDSPTLDQSIQVLSTLVASAG